MRELSPTEWQDFMLVLAENPDLTPSRLRELLNAGRARRTSEAIRPRTIADIVELVKLKLVTREEARKFMRLTVRKPPARSPRP